MADKSLGPQDYLYEAFDPDGNSIIAIMCRRTIYERKDGTLYVRLGTAKYPLIRQADGSFYQKT